jgi:hypothetical protein
VYQNLLLVGEEIIGEGHNLGAQQPELLKVCIGEDLTGKFESFLGDLDQILTGYTAES